MITRLEAAGLVQRRPCPDDGRAINVTLTEQGWEKVVQAAPGHVETVRRNVLDVLNPQQVSELADLSARILTQLDPESKMFPQDEEP